MFRRNPFAAKAAASPRTPISPSPATGPIPEDEPAPSTPIVSSIQTAWNDPPTSWASSTAAYDENPKYTTANHSYTHRRRKSSLITGLIARQNDPYQPTYKDWRQRTPESPRGSFSLDSGIPKEHDGDFRSRKKTKITATVLVVIVLALFGTLIFGGPLPLANLKDLTNPFTGTFAGDIWPARISNPELEWKKYVPDIKVDWDLQRFIPQKHWSGSSTAGQAQLHTVSSVSSTTSAFHLNTDMLSFTPETISKVTIRASPTPSLVPIEGDVSDGQDEQRSVVRPATEPVHIDKYSVTEVGPPVQARSETPHESDTREEEHVATGPPSHVEEMWRKHARVITPIAAETREEVASPPADAVPVNTAIASEENGSS